jgi:hypothetical protein
LDIGPMAGPGTTMNQNAGVVAGDPSQTQTKIRHDQV